MKKWIVGLLASNLIAVQGHSVENFDNLDVETLRQLLVVPASKETGAADLFRSLWRDPKRRERVAKLVSSDKEMHALAERGREFTESYFKMMEEDFGTGLMAFALAPEAEVLRRLRASDHSRMAEPREGARQELEARLLALSDTLSRFSLPASTGVPQLEGARYASWEGEAAYQFFKQRYTRYLITPTDRPQPAPDAVRRFKQQMIRLLEEVKALNFEKFMRRSLSEARFHLLFNDQERKAELDSSDIADVQMEALRPSAELKSDEIMEVRQRRGIWRRWVDFLGRRWLKKDIEFAKNVYLPQWIRSNSSPRVIRLVVELKNGGSRELVLSERTLNDWINSTRPFGYFGAPNENLVVRRYLIEAASRNAHMTDLIAFLEETPDRDLEEFRRRLEKRVSEYEYKSSLIGQTLTERLRAYRRAIDPKDPSVSTFWAGYGVHPDYWIIRDEVAKSMQNDKTAKREGKRELRRNNFRYQSNEQRVRYGFFRKLNASLIAAAVAGSLWVGDQWLNNQDFDPIEWTISLKDKIPDADSFQTPEWMHNARVAWDEFLDKNTQGQNDEQSGGNKTGTEEKDSSWWSKPKVDHQPTGFSMSGFDAPQNFQINGDSRQGSGGRDELGGSGPSTDFGWDIPFKVTNSSQVILYFLPQNISADQLPQTYDFIRKANFTPELDADKDKLSEPASSAIRLNLKGNGAEADFSAVTNLPNYAYKGRIPIAVPDRSALIQLELRDTAKRRLVEGRDYRVYRMKTNHLIWVELARDFGGIGYKADYKLSSRPSDLPRPMVELRKTVLESEIADMKAVGMTQMATKLSMALQTKWSAHVDEVSMNFSSSATYTYSSKMWRIRGPEGNPFRPYTKFLNEKGELHYQCTGSNAAFRTFMNLYYSRAGLTQYTADNITAYVMTQDAPVLTFDGAHYRTVIFDKNADAKYRVLDATPGGNAFGGNASPVKIIPKEKYELKDPVKDVPPDIPAKQEDIEIKGVLPRRPHVPVPREERSEGSMEKNPARPEDLNTEQSQERLLQRLKELQTLRLRAKQFLLQQAQEDRAIHRMVGNTDTPGHSAIVLAKRLEDYVMSRMNPQAALAEFTSAALRWPQAGPSQAAYLTQAKALLQEWRSSGQEAGEIIQRLSREQAARFQAQSRFVEQETTGQKGSSREFTLDDTYQALVRKIFRVMEQTEWGVLEPAYRERFKSCEPDLFPGGG